MLRVFEDFSRKFLEFMEKFGKIKKRKRRDFEIIFFFGKMFSLKKKENENCEKFWIIVEIKTKCNIIILL